MEIVLSTPEFATINLHHVSIDQSLTHLKLLVINPQSSTFVTIDSESLNQNKTTIRSIPFTPDVNDMRILASLDGLICVGIKKRNELMIWNPSTGAYKKLSNYNSPCFFNTYGNAIGFYFNTCDYDYKLLHVDSSDNAMGAYIYSRRSDSWRKIQSLKNDDRRNSNYHWSPATFSGQSLYFTVINKTTSFQRCIISFDVMSEKFREIQFPPVPNGVFFRGTLMIVKGCIHFCVAYGTISVKSEGSLVNAEGDLWKMDGDGWMKVANFSRERYFSLLSSKAWYYRICVTRSTDWLAISENNNSFFKIDLEEFATNYSVNGYGNMLCPHHRTLYLETLVSPHP